MSLPLFTKNVSVISALDDCPDMDSAELKGKFDEAGELLKEYINSELIPAIQAEIDYLAEEIRGK